MTAAEAIALLDAIAANGACEPETAHIEADNVLLDFIPAAVYAAYRRVQVAAGSWWFA
jgi:hypothetical protein